MNTLGPRFQASPAILTVRSSRRGITCDGTSRRDFLRVGALGLGGLSLPDLLQAREAGVPIARSAKATSVVWVWLAGGPSQIETFDPKPNAPEEFRSATGAVRTKLPGVEFGGTFPRLAAMADKLAIVRSFSHSDSGHGGGTHWLMTGHDTGIRSNARSS
jgi:hypothetical protein